MNRKMILLAIVSLALVSLACSIQIDLPDTDVKTGPTVTDDISVPYEDTITDNYDVTVEFGAGELAIQPGSETELISGTASYNVVDFKPEISQVNNNVTIEQGNLKFGGIPFINQDIVNQWELFLGSQPGKPVNLTINAGAYTGDYELGGLWISSLEVNDGASKVNLRFSEPNQAEMESLTYTTGASTVTLEGLGNASPSDMTFHSGAGNYTLDFSGQLSQDMQVNISSGVSTVTIIMPEGVSAVLTNDSTLITISADGDWTQSGNTFQHPGTGYTITIDAELGAGTLRLETGD